MAWRNSLDLPEYRARAKDVTEAEKVVNAALVEVELKSRHFAKGWNLGSESEPTILLGYEERLDAERVAGEAKASRLAIPDRGGVHSFGAQPHFVAPAKIAFEQGLDIAPRPEGTSIAKVPAQLAVIDDLAVTDDRVAIVSARDWLPTTFDIDDAETPRSKAEIAVDERVEIVRTAMNEAIALTGNDGPIDRPPASSVPARNSAHRSAALALVAPRPVRIKARQDE
jgi:hypothetical protein